MSDQPKGRAAIEAFQAQGVLQPGTEGFWQVWAARPLHLRPGDILLSKVGDTSEAEVDYVEELFVAKSAARRGFVNHEGQRLTVGIGASVVIVRWGTHGTLAG
jgi:hypothetical protein